MELVHDAVDQVHGVDPWVYRISLNEGRPPGDLRLRLKQRTGTVAFNLEH
jgi:hypothetical protein